MREHLGALQRHEISFDQFVRRTRPHWRRLAARLYSRWRAKLPDGVMLEDIEQELLYHAWLCVDHWEPARGRSIEDYVVFNACAKAVRWIHIQRNAYRRSEKEPSRFPAAASAALGTVPELPYEADLDALLDKRRQFFERLYAARGLQRVALQALVMARGDIRRAGALLYEAMPAQTRVAKRWTERSTVRMVERSLVA